jgi:predicted anti-sigma-YlaC factor YlaD
MEPKLSCRDVVASLDAHLALELEPEATAAITAHLARCRQCGNYAKTYVDAIQVGKTAVGREDDQLPEELVKAILDARQQSS